MKEQQILGLKFVSHLKKGSKLAAASASSAKSWAWRRAFSFVLFFGPNAKLKNVFQIIDPKRFSNFDPKRFDFVCYMPKNLLHKSPLGGVDDGFA